MLDHANRLEDEGHKIIKLNIGNPGAFGFDAPDGSFAMSFTTCARRRVTAIPRACSRRVKAIMQRYQVDG